MFKNAFTLIEIAIALVIIGVIAGAITAGSSLIRASELRGLVEEMEQFRNNMHLFEAKYNGKAGDLHNATEFWGALNVSAIACRSIAATDKRTCNGNGDGNIVNHEGFRMWQHLSNSGLLPGQFTGTAGSLGPNDAVSGENVPISSIENVDYMMQYLQNGYYLYFNTVKGNIFFTGAGGSGGAHQPWEPYLTSLELFNIDKKIDDGHPVYGSVIAQKAWIGPNGGYGCTTSNDEDTAEYNLGKEGKICAFYGLFID